MEHDRRRRMLARESGYRRVSTSTTAAAVAGTALSVAFGVALMQSASAASSASVAAPAGAAATNPQTPQTPQSPSQLAAAPSPTSSATLSALRPPSKAPRRATTHPSASRHAVAPKPSRTPLPPPPKPSPSPTTGGS
jgi:multifunctional 2-oxoglutarate metabolism enzyme